MKLSGISNTLAFSTVLYLTCQPNQIDAFSPIPSSLVPMKPSLRQVDSRQSSIIPLLARPEERRIERDWAYTDENGDKYEANGKLKVKVFIPEEGNVEGCVFFMHGFSQYTKAYQGTLQNVANSANVAIISTETGITSWIVLGELLSKPLELIRDRNRAQFVLQRALSQDTIQCIDMVTEGAKVFQDLKITSNIPLGVSGHSMGGGLSFPVAADRSQIKHVFTMAPATGVDEFNPIVHGVKKRVAEKSMLLAGSWDLIARANGVEEIAKESNKKKKDTSIFVDISRGLHTGFEDKLVITSIPLSRILGQFLDLPALSEFIAFSILNFIRTNTGQLEGSEELMKFFFTQMVKGGDVTPQDADQYLKKNLKSSWYENFKIKYE